MTEKHEHSMKGFIFGDNNWFLIDGALNLKIKITNKDILSVLNEILKEITADKVPFIVAYHTKENCNITWFASGRYIDGRIKSAQFKGLAHCVVNCVYEIIIKNPDYYGVRDVIKELTEEEQHKLEKLIKQSQKEALRSLIWPWCKDN